MNVKQVTGISQIDVGDYSKVESKKTYFHFLLSNQYKKFRQYCIIQSVVKIIIIGLSSNQ